MGTTPHPTAIRFVEDDHLLEITFSDDVTHEYRTEILRGYCPCAHCQGHGSMPHDWNELRREPEVLISDISQVGNYAICIAWEDGHNTGVYSFEILRQIAEEPSEVLGDYPPEQMDDVDW